MTDPRTYAKALVPVVAMIVLAILNTLQVTPEMSVEQAVTTILGLVAGLVYLVPNKAK